MTHHSLHTARDRRELNGPDWRWLLILGAVLTVGGVMAFMNPFEASLTAVAIAGAIFVTAGALQLWIAFKDGGPAGARFISALLGLLLLAFGVALIANPLAGILSLTLMVAGFLIAMGTLRLWLAYRLRAFDGWKWMATAGAISLALGFFILLALPGAAAGVLGIFLGAELVSSGVGAAVLAWRMR